MAIAVRAPDLEDTYTEAERWSDPDRGILTLAVPPLLTRPSEVLGHAIAALGGAPLSRPASGEAQALENALVRLRAHHVHVIVLLHSFWIPAGVVRELAGTLGAVGIRLFVVIHPAPDLDASIEPWAEEIWEWPTLRRWVADAVRSSRSDEPEVHQLVDFPALGLVAPVSISRLPIAATVKPGQQEALRRRLGGDPTLEGAAEVLLRALDAAGSDERDTVLHAAAPALAEAGFAVFREERRAAAARPAWRDLRRVADPVSAAAVALAALGLDEFEIAALKGGDVADDGARVRSPRGWQLVEPAARPYLVARRLITARAADPYLTDGNLPVTPSRVRVIVREGLAALGRTLDPVDFGERLSTSQRRLMERGLLLRPAPRPAHLPSVPDGLGRRCRHGLPGWIPSSSFGVTHSQRLCHARRPEDVRPACAGYAVTAIDGGATAAFRLTLDGTAAGTAWLVGTRRGPVWVESLRFDPPSAIAVGDLVRAVQRDAP